MTEGTAPVSTPVVAPEGVPPRKETTFSGDVLRLVSGTTIAQGIGVLATPFLTRLYGPDAFGTLALFTSITGIIGVVACLRYELAIMLPEADEEAANLLAVSLLSVVGVTLLTIPAVTWGRGLIVRLLNAPELGPYLWAVPVAVFFGGVFHALNYWNSREKEFGRLSVAKVANTGVAYAMKADAALAGYAGGGPLIAATLLGSFTSVGVLARATQHLDGGRLRRMVGLRGISGSARRHRKFPLFSTWSALMSTISLQIPTLLLSAFFSSTIVGFYAVGHRVLGMPASLIGAALGQVFFQRAAAARSSGTLPALVERVFCLLAALSAFPFALLMIIGVDLFELFLGASWGEAGRFAQILAPWMMTIFVSSPLSTLLSVAERQGAELGFQVAFVVTRVASLLIGGFAGDVRLGLVLYSGSGALVALGKLLFTLGSVRVARYPMIRKFGATAGIALAWLAPVAYLKYLVVPSPLLLTVAGLVVTILYYASVVLVSRDLRDLVGRSARRLSLHLSHAGSGA